MAAPTAVNAASPGRPARAFEAPSADDAGAPEVGVPFGCGLVFPVSQGHDTGTHQHGDTYAWDFRMPEGTPVVAAADGVVRMARGDSTVGGCDVRFAPFANYVVVEHANGVETQYLHFSEVSVQPGERVRKGELLGRSGNTGWSCGAHLHFKVAMRKSGGWNNPSIPARISGYGDPVRGTLVTAPACQTGPEVRMAKSASEAKVRAADAKADASLTPRVQRAGGKVVGVVDAVQDAAATAATVVAPASQDTR